jgi:RNase adapter protein RapZ
MTEFLLITGLSGAGRSNAANTFEDLGWFVIDNLPPSLIGKVAELVGAPGSTTERVALVVGTGPLLEYLDELPGSLEALRSTGARVRTLFLEASDEVLIRRYENTRRPHPLAAERVSEAIERERLALDPVKAEADVVVDTTDLNVHQLRDRLLDIFARDAEHDLQTNVVSFGFKHGVPLDVDMVFDCRFLPNPHWVDELRPLTGLDEPVREYVLGQPESEAFLAKVDDLLALLLPAFVKEGKSYLSIAVGCTGGRHRSVVIAEELARLLAKRGFEPTVQHRDVAR